MRPSIWRLLAAAAAVVPVWTEAQSNTPLRYETVAQDSLVSAMMMMLINEDSVLIIDKVENNPYKFDDGTPAWYSLFNTKTKQLKALRGRTNAFCAGGGVMANGTWAVFGGNKNINYTGDADDGQGPYRSYNGLKAIRFIDPTVTYDGVNVLDDQTQQMQSLRWYPGVEVLATGEVVLIGGSTWGGYINRASAASLSRDQILANAGQNPTYEYFPSRGDPKQSEFMIKTVGLNMYAHTFLMPSGRIFMNANVSNVLWDHEQNVEEALPDTPGNVVRVYPASGATAMLPLTKANNWTPTLLFCGGSVMTESQWGNYTGPAINVQTVEASKDCSSITPENSDGSSSGSGWVHEENMPEGRTMGQFIHLPTGEMLIVNGATHGTAGYTQGRSTYIVNGVDTEGLAQNPTFTPLLYDPSKPLGKRLSRDGFGSTNIARLYHSTAMLLPDGAVLIAGSNPHFNYANNMPVGTSPQGYNTTYELEYWYPSYYFEKRPVVSGIPTSIPFGGSPFNITVSAETMGKAANALAGQTKIMVIRPGFTTHAMNMGQRSLQLDSTYVVQDDGSVTFIVNPFPRNANLFVAGPALFFVTVNGIPSQGKMITVGVSGDGNIGAMPWTPVLGAELQTLPAPVLNNKFNAALPASPSSSGDKKGLTLGGIIGIAAAAGACLLIVALLFLRFRKRQRNELDGKGQFRSVALNDYSAAGKRSSTATAGTTQTSPYGNSSGFDPYAPTPRMHRFEGSMDGRSSMHSLGRMTLNEPMVPADPYRDVYSAPSPHFQENSHRASWMPDDNSEGGWAAASYYAHPRAPSFASAHSGAPGSPAPRHASFASAMQTPGSPYQQQAPLPPASPAPSYRPQSPAVRPGSYQQPPTQHLES